MSKKIAITGVSGFVGSHIAEKVLQAGYEVIGIDNLSSGIDYTPTNIEFINADLSKLSFYKNCYSIENVDAIVHAAAYADLRKNWTNINERDKLFSNNEVATINLLNVKKDIPIIFLSTSAIYGSSSYNKITTRPLVESDASPETIESPYAASKFACESYISAWSYSNDVPWYSLRLVNQIGPRTHKGVIVDFLKMIRENHHIHAADNGEQKKNWISVEDTADAVVRLLDTSNLVPLGVYNLTSDERWSWRDIVRVMKEMYYEKYPNSTEPFTISYEERLAGAIGDPVNLYVSGEKLKPYYFPHRSVEKAVRETLTFLGWPY